MVSQSVRGPIEYHPDSSEGTVFLLLLSSYFSRGVGCLLDCQPNLVMIVRNHVRYREYWTLALSNFRSAGRYRKTAFFPPEINDLQNVLFSGPEG